MRSRQVSSVRQVETDMKTARSAEKRNLNTVVGVPLKSFKRKACDLDLNEKQVAAVSGLRKRREHLCIERQARLGRVNPYIVEAKLVPMMQMPPSRRTVHYVLLRRSRLRQNTCLSDEPTAQW